MNDSMRLVEYSHLIDSFRNAGYCFAGFDQRTSDFPPRRRVIMRHDIDFSLTLACEMAAWEYQKDVQATYFVQLRSPLYNVLSKESQSQLRLISSFGHTVGMHFDASAYKELGSFSVQNELAVFSSFFPTLLTTPVSIHRPPRGLDRIREWTADLHVSSVYDDLWTSEFEYFSDSGGSWQRGYPVDSDAFAARRDIHILMHPLWWLIHGSTPSSKLRTFASHAGQDIAGHIRSSAVSFDF